MRGGAGERELFRQVLKYLDKHNPEDAARLMPKIPEIGRWDDMFVYENKNNRYRAFVMIGDALRERNGLAAKWMPRKGELAAELRKFFGMSPKFYRKSLVNLTSVVEQKMCAKAWDSINFSHVPSLAHSRYKKAFYRNATEYYTEYVASLVKGDDPKVKINAGAVYPHDVIKSLKLNPYGDYKDLSKTEIDAICEQWKALENFMGDASVLPLVDVSGSMFCPAGGSKTVQCIDVAVALGLYCADKNTGKFKDMFLTFSTAPELLQLKGNVVEKVAQMVKSKWGMSTNIVGAMNKILATAKSAGVPQEEMPEMLLIMSDMQFDRCASFDDSAMETIERQYEAAGYTVPKIVFWNLNAQDNVPVKFDKSGVALVSGFSPSIMKALLSGNQEEFTPEAIMRRTVEIPRYDLG